MIVLLNNDGGGIFSFLPQASALTEQRFEQLFGTPHGTDLVGIARAHRLDATTATSVAELRTSLATAGPTVTRIATDRRANVLMHDALNLAVADAL